MSIHINKEFVYKKRNLTNHYQNMFKFNATEEQELYVSYYTQTNSK